MNNVELWPGSQRGYPFLGMVAATEARCIMQSYLKVLALIAGLVGAYLALLPFIV